MREELDLKEDVKLHLRESALLQKQWFTYVFEAVEKLNVRMEENTLQVQKEREEFFRALVDLKEKLNDQMSLVSKEQAAELKDLEKKLMGFIENVRVKFSDIDSVGVYNSKQGEGFVALEKQLREDIIKVVVEQQKVNTAFKEDINTLIEGHTIIKTKLTVYVALISLATTTIIGVLATSLLIIFKDVLKAWLG